MPAKISLPTSNDTESWKAFVTAFLEISPGGAASIDHVDRYVETMRWIPPAKKLGARALELGSTALFQELLREYFGYDEVHGTAFIPTDRKSYFRRLDTISSRPWYMTHKVNLEEEPIPLDDNYFDFVLACEIVEHMEVDPMFFVAEINRVCSPGGHLLLTTPNSTSSRILWSILNGYRPHFYMQYSRDRALYRHNYEYDVDMITKLVTSGGFEIEKIKTIDCFAPQVPEAMKVLEREGFSTEERGDNIFVVARKVSGVTDRYPHGVYD